MVTGRPRSWSVAFHNESPRASHEEPHGPETWSSRLIRSSSRNRPPSKLAVSCVPDGISTAVIDYLLPITRQDQPCPLIAVRCQRPHKKAQKISRSPIRGSQELVHDPDTCLQSGQRDALVGAVEHGVV